MPVPKGTRIGGRQKGTPNKATAEIKLIARKYGEDAIKELARIMSEGENEQARIAAIKELLDRGFGKATQPVGQDPDFAPVFQILTGVPRG